MAAQKKNIELLPQEDWEKGTFGKILKWVLTIGRYIVITTELVVILAFFSRFKLDRDLTNLYEEIKQKQAIVEASSNFESEFRFLQKRLQNIETIKQDQAVASQTIKEISPLIPLDVSFKDFTVSGQKVNLTATALSEQGLATFLANLKASTKFKNLELTNVSSGAEKGVGIQFELSSEFAPI